jgi:hypothetical protein
MLDIAFQERVVGLGDCGAHQTGSCEGEQNECFFHGFCLDLPMVKIPGL